MDITKSEDVDITLDAQEVLDMVLRRHPELEYLREHHMVMFANQTLERGDGNEVTTQSILSLHWKVRR